MRLKNQKGVIDVITVIVIAVALVIVGCLFLFRNNDNVGRPKVFRSIKTSNLQIPTPTPFLFQEMTIPYLRSRSYSSQLGELEYYSENSSYTSYLTSYDSDRLKINGYLTIPKGPVPRSSENEVGWPAVIFVHGYIPPQEYQTEKNYISYTDALADEGLIVFKIDLRGHDESEGVAMGAYYSEAYVVDVLNAYAALKNSGFVDPGRIGLWGHSMGGNVVFRGFIAMPEIKKAVIWAGAVYTYEDFSDYRISDRSYQPPPQQSERRRRRQELFDTYGEFDPNSEFWKQIPGTNYLNGVTGEIQIHHAVDDNVVKIGYSRNLIEVLKDSEIKAELFEYPFGGHNIIGSSFTQAMQRSADFLKD